MRVFAALLVAALALAACAPGTAYQDDCDILTTTDTAKLYSNACNDSYSGGGSSAPSTYTYSGGGGGGGGGGNNGGGHPNNGFGNGGGDGSPNGRDDTGR